MLSSAEILFAGVCCGKEGDKSRVTKLPKGIAALSDNTMVYKRALSQFSREHIKMDETIALCLSWLLIWFYRVSLLP